MHLMNGSKRYFLSPEGLLLMWHILLDPLQYLYHECGHIKTPNIATILKGTNPERSWYKYWNWSCNNYGYELPASTCGHQTIPQGFSWRVIWHENSNCCRHGSWPGCNCCLQRSHWFQHGAWPPEHESWLHYNHWQEGRISLQQDLSQKAQLLIRVESLTSVQSLI